MSEAAHSSAGTGAVELAPGTHMCCMYRGPEERDDLVLPFLGKLILRSSDEPIFDPDSFDVEGFSAMKLHPRIWLSGLVLDNPFHEPTP